MFENIFYTIAVINNHDDEKTSNVIWIQNSMTSSEAAGPTNSLFETEHSHILPPDIIPYKYGKFTPFCPIID